MLKIPLAGAVCLRMPTQLSRAKPAFFTSTIVKILSKSIAPFQNQFGIESRNFVSSNQRTMEFLKIFGIIFSVFGISFLLINIRYIITGNEFRGSCASNNPMIKGNLGECGLCGKKAEEACQMPEVKG